MVFFLRNQLYLGHTGVTSFRMQFEKIRRGLLREANVERESGLCWLKQRGLEREICILLGAYQVV